MSNKINWPVTVLATLASVLVVFFIMLVACAAEKPPSYGMGQIVYIGTDSTVLLKVGEDTLIVVPVIAGQYYTIGECRFYAVAGDGQYRLTTSSESITGAVDAIKECMPPLP